MGYKIEAGEYEEAQKNLQADPLEAEGKFKVELKEVKEVEISGEIKTVIEFKVTEGKQEGKIKSEWLRFKQEWETDMSYMEDKQKKQHYAAVNTIEKISVALNAPIQDVVEDLQKHLGRKLGIEVKKSEYNGKTYYNTKAYVALPDEPKQKKEVAAEELDDEIPF